MTITTHARWLARAPFCATEVAEASRFCPGCGKTADDIRAEKVRRGPAA